MMGKMTTLALILVLLAASLETTLSFEITSRAGERRLLRANPAARQDRSLAYDDEVGPTIDPGPTTGAPPPLDPSATDLVSTFDTTNGEITGGGTPTTDLLPAPTTSTSQTTPASDRVPCVSLPLSLAYSFQVAASDAASAMTAAIYVSRQVQSVLQAQLVADAVDCTKGSIMNVVESAPPAMENESCEVSSSMQAASMTCYFMSAGVQLAYTGPSDQTSREVEAAIGLVPSAFDTLSGPNEIEFGDVTEIPFGGDGGGEDDSTTSPGDGGGGKKDDKGTDGGRESDSDGGKKGDKGADEGKADNSGGDQKDDKGTNEDKTNDGGDTDDPGTGVDEKDDSDAEGDNTNGPDGGGKDSDNAGKSENPSAGNANVTVTDPEEAAEDKTNGEDLNVGNDDGSDEADDDMTSTTSREKPGRTNLSQGARVYVTCFLLAIIFAAIALAIFTVKKRQNRGKALPVERQFDSNNADIEGPLDLLAKDNQRLSPKDTESTAGDQSLDSGFFHSPTNSCASSGADDDYSTIFPSKNVLATGSLQHVLPLPQKEQLKPQQTYSRRQPDPESPPSSPLSHNDASRSFSLQGSPILANGNDPSDHSVLYDVIMTPAGRITRVHVETLDAAEDRENIAKSYSNTIAPNGIPRARSSPTGLQASSYATTANDVSRSPSISSSPYCFSRSRSLFDCNSSIDDTVDL